MRCPIWVRAASAALAFGFAVTGEPIVELPSSRVTYRGTVHDSVEHFQNIRFAHDTSGERRFAPPEPYAPPEGSEVDATAPGLACPQSKAGLPPLLDAVAEFGEDCLNLRIARPVGTAAQDKLPVVVWLHGGGVVRGSAYDSHFDPENLVRLSASLGKPVIYVALQYRLTIFGFARLPRLLDQKSLNVGMRDQRAGFEWVRDNIAAFGGDPERITAFGLSAGGSFTSVQMMAYGGERGVPFTQAWVMSGPPGTGLNASSDITETHTRAVARDLGCAGDEDEELLTCLREVPVEKLTETAMAYSAKNHPPFGLFTFLPSVDGDFLPDRPSLLLKSGRFVKGIPVVLGWTQDDGATNVGPAKMFQSEGDMRRTISKYAHALTDEDYKELFDHYPPADFEEDVRNYRSLKDESDPAVPVQYFRVSRIVRDILFTCSSIEFGYETSRQSRASDPTFPGVRLYDLNQSMFTPMFKDAGRPYIRVSHGSDTNYIFNGVFPEGQITDADQRLSKSLAGSFIHFAYTGDPTVAESEGFGSWPESFPEPRLEEYPGAGPTRMNIQVIGGPLGTGSCSLSGEQGGGAIHLAAEEGRMQMPVLGGVEFGQMESADSHERRRELERERLLERCAYIATLSEKLGV
ncbi:Alpha/Beta hydrolase protein [Durotheca rogersii]|uniref:Alpha/Beta hydrolase protein n=1 Tax=Durotheca rogersii TaxID=419775 RepID=UPI00222048AD|nr:Alpha/Beta hydrolase protein [Durotheca rogersii]KAI5865150.1 Alpha/Beta hydrolase protein [Durotheca rogersii]